MYKYSIIPLFAVLLLWGCEETVDLDTDQAPPRYIIEGSVTNELTDHYVKISTSTDFYNKNGTPRVSDASVVVSDDQNHEYLFIESETEPGLYTSRFEGEIGRTYSMQVTMPTGEAFTASDQMYEVQPVDSLTWEIDEEEQEDPEEEGLFYSLRIFAREPQETVDYYLFKFYRNDSLQNFDSQTGLFYADDELIGGYIYGLEAPAYFRQGDEATFTMYRISREAYLFYKDLDITLNGDGGMFGPSPTNPRTNIKGPDGAGIGFFQASAVVRKTIIVGE
uniref:DUF4249 domain-containing protein n=1 Tax=Roseihalotalea indica TaxID=2867963 RepID=A0AA49GKD6_9BACT|nr:DUF4249 domain-containing protein [Tunicatimonas sp. TK19036]